MAIAERLDLNLFSIIYISPLFSRFEGAVPTKKLLRWGTLENVAQYLVLVSLVEELREFYRLSIICQRYAPWPFLPFEVPKVNLSLIPPAGITPSLRKEEIDACTLSSQIGAEELWRKSDWISVLICALIIDPKIRDAYSG
jgi:hypothetical protein